MKKWAGKKRNPEDVGRTPPRKRKRYPAGAPRKRARAAAKRRGEAHADARVKTLADRYERFHWGERPTRVIHVKDALVPDCAQLGALIEISVDGAPQSLAGHVAFDPRHPADRLHLILPPRKREELRQAMKKMDRHTADLNEIAQAAGGRQAKYPYPHIRAVPLGRATEIVYRTRKGGDFEDDKPVPDYQHHFGEESGIPPVLAVDVSGRLWLVGGNYRVTDAGIED